MYHEQQLQVDNQLSISYLNVGPVLEARDLILYQH